MAWFIVYPGAGTSIHYVISAGEILLIASVFIARKLLNISGGLRIIPDNDALTEAGKAKFFLKSWLVSFIVFILMYAAFYPGGFSPDSINQYEQAAGFKHYNDWHPVLHTLITFTLPLRLFGGWAGSIVLMQIVIASLALSYSSLVIAETGNRKYAAIFLAYTLLNPLTLAIIMYPWKDVAFAISAMLCMTFAVKVYFSGGGWLKRPRNVVLFVLFMSSATIFRHNGILFTFPLLAAVMLRADKNTGIMAAGGCIALVLAVRLVLYPCLGVAKPGYRITETTLAPMTVMLNAAYEAPDRVAPDIKDFIVKAAGENWRDNYVVGSFNSVKFKGISRDVIEEAGYTKIFGMTARCLRDAARPSIRGFAALTLMVYGICGPAEWAIYPGITENDYGIDYGGIRPLRLLFRAYYEICRLFLKPVFYHIGILLLITIMLILSRADFMRMCFALPILAYDFGTMLFLGGNDFRFFWCTYLVVPLVILVLLRNGTEAAS